MVASYIIPEVVVEVSTSVDVNDNGFEEELEVGGPRRIARLPGPAILDTALGERLDASLTASEDVVGVSPSI